MINIYFIIIGSFVTTVNIELLLRSFYVRDINYKRHPIQVTSDIICIPTKVRSSIHGVILHVHNFREKKNVIYIMITYLVMFTVFDLKAVFQGRSKITPLKISQTHIKTLKHTDLKPIDKLWFLST